MLDNWRDRHAGKTDISQLVYLSNLIGQDLSLVQPGGGNTSVKLEEDDAFGCRSRTLVVKGSGSDLRSIGPAGFTHLYLDRLALALTPGPSPVRGRGVGTPEEQMMSLMRACMLHPDRDPLPSVETPLHSVLPFRFIAHTHDVATLSLTDTPHAEEHVRRVYGGQVAFLEYARPGLPLAQRLAARLKPGLQGKETPGALDGAIALVMEKHGLAAWGESARECYANLRSVIEKAEAFVADRGSGKRVFGPTAGPALPKARRRRIAAAVMPVIRGELSRERRAVLHFDDSPEILGAIGGERFPEVAARGVMTPEHILRAGVRPLVVALNREAGIGAQHAAPLQDAVRQAIRKFRDQYLAYARSQGQAQPIPDFLKVILIPGVGMVCAGKDKRSAQVAAVCYRATIQAMAGAEAVEEFRFLPDADACEVEYWPLERRKVDESARARRDLDGKVALVIGGASGIGRATAIRLADGGAHVVVSDLDSDGAQAVSAEINARAPERAQAVPADVTDEASLETAFRQAVLHFGGIDILFYSPGVSPSLHSVAEMPLKEIERQLRVHYEGAVAATREASRIMLEQGLGGRLVYNASKAAYVPGEGAAAYGAAKAALVQYARNVAGELGRHAVTANYINADAVDTPLFRALVRQRAQRAGLSESDILERYEERSVFRTATVPPEAVADAVLWLASDGSAYTTGCVITVGGGHEGFPR